MASMDASASSTSPIVGETEAPKVRIKSLADEASASSTSPVVGETEAPKVGIKSWADEAEDSSQESTLDLKSLAIKEEVSRSLENLDDSSIQVKSIGKADGTPYTSAKSFEDLNLSPDLLKGIRFEMQFERPSKIQAVSLPMVLTPPYDHLIAQAHNGSGKTTCFVLGMLSRIDPEICNTQALCICPTRELAIQNIEVLRKMGKYTKITSECAVPADSANYVPISRREPITAHVVIGTPGTINKFISARKLSMRSIKILVYDEADHMLAESGFRSDSIRIMKDIQKSNPDCQVLLFSATFDDMVRDFSSKIVNELFKTRKANEMFVRKEELSLESVKQYMVQCPNDDAKIMVIRDRILELCGQFGQTIIFVRTRRNTAMLHDALAKDGYEVTVIQGALNLEERDKIVKEFRDGVTRILIATDIIARGFDQANVQLVVNFEPPVKYDRPSEPDCELYLHRVGRAGRFGRRGAVFNLLCGDREREIMSKIEKHFNIQVAEVPSWQSEEDFTDALDKAGLM